MFSNDRKCPLRCRICGKPICTKRPTVHSIIIYLLCFGWGRFASGYFFPGSPLQFGFFPLGFLISISFAFLLSVVYYRFFVRYVKTSASFSIELRSKKLVLSNVFTFDWDHVYISASGEGRAFLQERLQIKENLPSYGVRDSTRRLLFLYKGHAVFDGCYSENSMSFTPDDAILTRAEANFQRKSGGWFGKRGYQLIEK